MSIMAPGKCYELRTYTCLEGKLEALKNRFRDHTVRIFHKHGIESIGYWVPEDSGLSKNTLIYLVAHPSRDAADKNWKEFLDDPEWKKVVAESEAGGKIVLKMERIFLNPTEFSKLH
jgi:NIPSNAP protein